MSTLKSIYFSVKNRIGESYKLNIIQLVFILDAHDLPWPVVDIPSTVVDLFPSCVPAVTSVDMAGVVDTIAQNN